mmetsp:Transcript_68998/g.150825  ORF Transcript_68998/g.150825 Transcript_68998/m.150825 type:complete len:233 (-) Transcript_68998:257-955(-)|eukprot:CAMPEP_0206430084 /NCGR_PEP_ID=MMETSP0324_2-20121206/6612_1 /ASSEMBLY_ACC=CAM_ASM_000836 /TAXON_ID=2866 /ORGANISM="Crypthecodinium cohnii, Strain Seligo" /LENGTH=232 /DNA_ID=CAMNT_0053895861 /DNA_START=38 /DNA_END=736 /DNA_ORIENTATION=-
MGLAGSVAGSPLYSYLRSEFDRVCQGSEVLYLAQIQQLQPPQDVHLDLGHIATLYKLDSKKDGFLDFQELLAFAEFANTHKKLVGPLDFERKLRAQCVVDLYPNLNKGEGLSDFADWVVLLICQGEPPQFLPFAMPGTPYITRDHVMTLYELMQPYQIRSHIDQQGFLDMLQQIAESRGMMSLQDEELDDWVPTSVVQNWIRQFATSYCSLFRELGLVPPESAIETRTEPLL